MTQHTLKSRMKPKMFRDESISEKLKSAQRISDLKNLGPACQTEFDRANISLDKFKSWGWQKTLEKLVKTNPQHCHAMLAYAMIGALQNKEWNAISENDKKQARDFCQNLRKNLKKPKTK